MRRLGNRASRPPTSDGSRNSADHCSDRACGGSYGRACYDPRNATNRLTDLIPDTRCIAVVQHSAFSRLELVFAVHVYPLGINFATVSGDLKGQFRDQLSPLTSHKVQSRFTAVRDNIHVGTRGWNYDDWVGSFYPINTRPADFLPVYSRAFETVEVDSTFYGIPAPTTLEGWAARTTPGFIFALKMPQEVTHEQRLRDVTGASGQFFDAVRELGPKLGPILVQLGPDFEPNELPALVDFIERFRAIFDSQSNFGIVGGLPREFSRCSVIETLHSRLSKADGFREGRCCHSLVVRLLIFFT